MTRLLSRCNLQHLSDVGLHRNYMQRSMHEYGSYITGLRILRRRGPAIREAWFRFANGLASHGASGGSHLGATAPGPIAAADRVRQEVQLMRIEQVAASSRTERRQW